MTIQEIIDHIKARKRSYLDSTDKQDTVESVVYELEQVENMIKQLRLE